MTTLPLALVLLLLDIVQALEYNATIDDEDPRIAYTGADWETSLELSENSVHLNTSLLHDGTAHSADKGTNGAVFNFTGTAVWVQGTRVKGRSWRPPNVSFTLDGIESFFSSPPPEKPEQGPLYNVTLFHAKNLHNGPHSLRIRTNDGPPFILDSIIYSTLSMPVSAANGTEGQGDDTSTSRFPYEEATQGPAPESPNAGIVGGVVGGIFGVFIIAGLIGLYIIRRSQRKTHRSKNRKVNRGGSSSGGSSGQKRSDRERQLKKPSKAIEFNYSGPRPLDVPWIPPLKEPDIHKSRAGQASALSTYASESNSEGGRTTDMCHALTTESAHPLQPQPPEWWNQTKTELHHSSQTEGSTLDAEGVLERVMNHSPSPEFSTRSPARYGKDHPFRQL